MAQFSKQDQERITFLSLLSSAAQAGERDPYKTAMDWLQDMKGDGFFDADPTPERSAPSPRRESPSPSGSRGRDRQGSGGFKLKNPNAPATEKQVAKLLSLTEDYSKRDAEDMTMQEISDLIDALN